MLTAVPSSPLMKGQRKGFVFAYEKGNAMSEDGGCDWDWDWVCIGWMLRAV